MDNKLVYRKDILFCGEPLVLCCDGKCHKAWGIGSRPHVYLGDPTQTVYGEGFSQDYDSLPDDVDEDDYYYLADDELPDAPVDPGTYEGDHGKPQQESDILNKWCCRACERSEMVMSLEDLELPDFSKRQYNVAPHERE